VYEENFNSTNGWPVGDNSVRTLEVKNGKYYFEHKQTDKRRNVKTFDINKLDTSKDFEIEVSIQRLSSVNKNYAYGLMFGTKDENNTYHFFLSNNQYRTDQKKNGEYVNYKGWKNANSIKTGFYAYNKFKVKKSGNTLSYYMNGTFLESKSYNGFSGKKIGVHVFDKQKVAIDYIKVRQLSGNPLVVNNNTTTTTTTTKTQSKTILFEGFNSSSNPNKWPISNNSTVEFKIASGDYIIDHKIASGGYSSTIAKQYDTSRNFRLSAQIKHVSGVQSNGYGIVFGRKDNSNQHQFFISAGGSFIISKFENGSRTYIKNWTKSSHIKTGSGKYNTLTVKKTGSRFEYLINSKVVYTSYSYKSFGNRTGFIVYDKQKISVGYLSMTYTDSKPNVTNNNNTTASGEYVLQDYFTNNKNNWPVKNTSGTTVVGISNSYYNFEHLKASGGWAINIQKRIDTSRDFEITTNIKKISGISNYSYGFQWGKEGNNSFRFYITGNGYYKIARVVNNKEEVIKKFTKNSAIKTGNGAINTLKIKKEGGYYKYYVNNSYLTQTNFEAFYGHRLGYVVFNKQKIGVDNITIKYLKKNNNTIVTNNALSVPLHESFTSNSNGWNLSDNSNVKTRISNGKLYIKSNYDKGGAFISKKVNIDTNRDFIIETSITRLTSGASGSIALAFGRKNNTNEFDLFLSNDGSYLLRKLENNNSNKLIPWTSSNAIKKGTYQANKIKIVKSNNLLRIYINDQYINEAPYSNFFGNYMGFSVYNKQEVSIDYLNVTYPSASFNTPPKVVITEPVVQRGFKIVKTKKILVKGFATDKDGIFEITINGVEASVSGDGSFTANVPLKYGANDLVVKATDMKQASSTKTFTIKRKSPDVNNDDDDIVVVKDKDKIKTDKGFGTYYALLIGVSDYGDGAITDLDGLPTKDAQDLANVLISKYNFKRQNVVILNNSPKANDIIKEFSKLKKKVTDKDNLLVFYAGHGIYDEVNQIGAWLPSDADMEYELNLISNSQVVDYLKSIRSKHTLLVSDACFSGSIFKTRSFEKSPKSIQKKFELTSRKAITSGTLKTVPNKSMFLKYLLDRLKNNQKPYLSARQLFDRIEEPVMNNSPNTPQYGTIYGVGDEGGDFIFIKN
jgi:hypothetical protein